MLAYSGLCVLGKISQDPLLIVSLIKHICRLTVLSVPPGQQLSCILSCMYHGASPIVGVQLASVPGCLEVP